MPLMDFLDPKPSPIDLISSPRLSFSSEFLDESNFISICPDPHCQGEAERARPVMCNPEFEFLSGNLSADMMTADELFCEGKLLPFWQSHHNAHKPGTINLETSNARETSAENAQINRDDGRIRWLLDDDPSPRPPKCVVLWKELLRLKKQRSSTLSPSSSSSSSSSRGSKPEPLMKEERKEGTKGKDKSSKRGKKVDERTRAAAIRIRPVINVPICTTSQAKNRTALPPLFPLKKGRPERWQCS